MSAPAARVAPVPAAPVTIAIVSWNTRDLLARCLESLAPEALAGRADVWVVDNASDDGSPDLVRKRFDWVNLVASSENLGFGTATNTNLLGLTPVDLYNAQARQGFPIILGANEGIIVEATVPATGVWIANFTVSWAETSPNIPI